jgi:hypothetical protein
MSEFKGTIVKLDETQQVSAKFRKREFVVGTNEKYAQYVTFVAVQERCDMLDGARVGDQIQVDYKLTGRKWESPQGGIKYFNTVEATHILVDGKGSILDEQDMTDDEIMDDLFGTNTAQKKSLDYNKNTSFFDSDSDLPF